MNEPGDADLLVAARSVLLDALEALQAHLGAVVVIGAQAIYLHTGAAEVALAETTKDSDIALNPCVLRGTPLLQDVMARLPSVQTRPIASTTRTPTTSTASSSLSPPISSR